MKHSRLTTSAALALAVAAVAAPTASGFQDLRSPDTRDAAQAAGSVQPEAGQDLRSPDTRDAALGRGTFSAPEVTVVRVSEPAPSSDGLSWGDAGIGAGALFGFEVAIDLDWVVTVASPTNPSAQVTILGNDDPAAPGISIEVDDVEAIHARHRCS